MTDTTAPATLPVPVQHIHEVGIHTCPECGHQSHIGVVLLTASVTAPVSPDQPVLTADEHMHDCCARDECGTQVPHDVCRCTCGAAKWNSGGSWTGPNT